MIIFKEIMAGKELEMIPDERRRQILEIVGRNGYASVEELAAELYVSLPTIRRDLTSLEKEGSILRTHGGASFVRPDSYTSPFALRKRTLLEEKNRIGKTAASLIENNDSLFITSSSTCLSFVKYIPTGYHLEILTNGIPLAHLLAENMNIKVECPAGVYNYVHEGIYGSNVEYLINQRHARFCFMSCNGLDLEQGITFATELDFPMVQACRKRCDEMVLLVDHTKLKQIFYYKVMDLSDVDILITDQKLDSEWDEYCEKHNIKVLIGEAE